MKASAIICVFILLCHLCYSQNKTYYISASGNDGNDGLSTVTAWQTLTNVNALDLKTGDKIFLEGGSTFTGTIQLDQNDGGTSANPVLISSYGTGKATIFSPNASALYASNAGGTKLSNLIFRGNNSNTDGIYFEITQTSNDLNYLFIDSIEVFSFAGNGLLIGAYSTDKGFNDVSVLHSNFHDNGIAGMQTFGNYPMFSHNNFLISHCRFYNNLGTLNISSLSGSGLVVSGVDGGLVEYCESYNNGMNNRQPGGGPVGIWVYDTKNVTIQYCESHHNKAGLLKDGGGFDIDGGSQNCILQYCYSHDNEGPGLLMVEYGSLNEFTNNIIRYNISQNDARKNSCGGLAFYAEDALHQIKNCKVYNNTVYVDGNNLTDGTPSSVNIQSQNLSNVQISNNIFYVTKGVDLMNSLYALNTSELFFLNNNYYSSVAEGHFNWNGIDYTSLNEWKAAATGQETNGNTSMGITNNPLLINAGSGGTIGPVEGGSFNSLFGYALSPSSPLINKGINLLNMGTNDFFGNSVPQLLQYDIGAAESTLNTPLPLTIANFNALVQTNNIMLQWKVYNEEQIQKYEVLKSTDGTYFLVIGTVPAVKSFNYSFVDRENTGNAVYRLRYTDASGKSGLTSTLKVSTTATNKVSVYCNQGQEVLLRMLCDQTTMITICIYNVSGSLMSSLQLQLQKGSNNIMLPGSAHWEAGVYVFSVMSSNSPPKILKFIKTF